MAAASLSPNGSEDMEISDKATEGMVSDVVGSDDQWMKD